MQPLPPKSCTASSACAAGSALVTPTTSIRSPRSRPLAGIGSASVQRRIALGPRAGARVLQLGREPNAPWVRSRGPCQAHLGGFDHSPDKGQKLTESSLSDADPPHPPAPAPGLSGAAYTGRVHDLQDLPRSEERR